mgnify:CR=1 FL=1
MTGGAKAMSNNGMPRVERPELVLFDWDGTLVDTFPLLFAAHNYVRGELGIEMWSEAEALKNIRKPAREAFPSMFGDKWEEAVDLYYDYVTKHHLEKIEPLNGAKELLLLLKKWSVPVGVVSNKKHDLLLKEINHLNWTPLIQNVVGAGQTKRGKPDPAPLLHAIELFASQPGGRPESGKKIWYIGDTAEDMACALSANIQPVFVECGFGQRNELDRRSVSYIFQNLDLLHKSLEKSQ